MRPLFHKNPFTWPNQKDGALLPFNKCPRTSNQDNGMSGFITTVWGFQVSSLFCNIVLSTSALTHCDGTPVIDARHD